MYWEKYSSQKKKDMGLIKKIICGNLVGFIFSSFARLFLGGGKCQHLSFHSVYASIFFLIASHEQICLSPVISMDMSINSLPKKCPSFV